MSRAAPLLLTLLLRAAWAAGPTVYPWPHDANAATALTRFPPPPGFVRLPASAGSFAEWLRCLPLHPPDWPVHLFDGGVKHWQDLHAAVLDIDVGSVDLQQCADAVMRLRAEYLRAAGLDTQIAFHFTSGDLASWSDWRDGKRPVVQGNRVRWRGDATPDSSYVTFRAYLNSVFMYAGSASLEQELVRVTDPACVEPGDVFIHGGSPGHAVIVMDVAENDRGQRVFMIAQSYMPAQEIHILRNPNRPGDIWFPAESAGVLATPEWTFRYEDVRRFPSP